jgi:hypothetical protein
LVSHSGRCWPWRPVIITGEGAQVPGEGVQVRAAGQDLGELGLLAGFEGGGAGQQPAGDLAGFGHGRRWRRGGQLAERADVAAYRPRAAPPAAGSQLGVQDRGAGDPFVPPLVQARLERAGAVFPAGGPGQQLISGGGAGEPQHGVAGQAQGAAGRAQ